MMKDGVVTLPAVLPVDLRDSGGIGCLCRRHYEPFSQSFDMHYALELGVVLSGRMSRCYSHFEQELTAGTVWLCDMWEVHGYRMGAAETEVAVLLFDLELLHRLSGSEFNLVTPFRLPPEERPQMAPVQQAAALAIGRNIADVANGGKSGFAPFYLQTYLLELLLLLFEHLPAGSLLPPPDENVLNLVIDQVVRRHGQLELGEAARIVNMTERKFSEHFTRLAGMSFHAFCLRHRLSGAAAALLRTDRTLDEIAGQWGFTDKSHFHRRFSELYGVSPGAYRKCR